MRPGVRRWVWCVVACAVCGFLPREVSAQAADEPVRVWLSGGWGGAYARGLDVNGALAVQLVGQWGRHSVALRGLYAGDLGLAGGNGRSVEATSLLYGRRATTSFGFASLSTGVSGVTTEGPGGSGLADRTTVGLPVVVEAALQTTPVGVGIQAFGNLNSAASYAGILVMVYFGWMP